MLNSLKIVLRIFKTFFREVVTYLKKAIRHASIRTRYPYLQFDNTCEVVIDGEVFANGNVCIGARSRVFVPKGSKIIFGGGNVILNDVLIAPRGTIHIGYGTSLQDRCTVLGDVKIGSLTLLAPNIFISSGSHQIYGSRHYSAFFPIKVQDYLVPFTQKEILIGSDVWIGINSTIMPGINIEDGSVIGANSILLNNTEKFGVYAGVPARKIGSRWIGPHKQINA